MNQMLAMSQTAVPCVLQPRSIGYRVQPSHTSFSLPKVLKSHRSLAKEAKPSVDPRTSCRRLHVSGPGSPQHMTTTTRTMCTATHFLEDNEPSNEARVSHSGCPGQSKDVVKPTSNAARSAFAGAKPSVDPRTTSRRLPVSGTGSTQLMTTTTRTMSTATLVPRIRCPIERSKRVTLWLLWPIERRRQVHKQYRSHHSWRLDQPSH